MHYDEIAERVRFHMQEEEGCKTMCRIFEEYGDEYVAEAKIEFVEKLLRDDSFSNEKIADMTDVSLEQVRQIAASLASEPAR